MAKRTLNTVTPELDKAISPGQAITYRSGLAGTVLTVSAKGEAPVYTQSEDGRVVAHRADGRVSERVDNPFDIIPLRRSIMVRVELLADSKDVLYTACAIDGDPLREPGSKVLAIWEHEYTAD